MNFLLSDEQTQIVDSLHDLLTERMPVSRFRPPAPQIGNSDQAFWPQLGELGFLGIGLPEEHGGIGLSAAEEKADQVGGDSEKPDEQFLEVLRIASSRGYSLIPEVESVRARIEVGDQRADQLQKKLDEATAANDELAEKIDFFGKRKQRYLRRLTRSRG